LNKNKDVFAWSAKDLKGVDRDIIEHTMEMVKNNSKKVETQENVRRKSESRRS
jgi:hypothetical protein